MTKPMTPEGVYGHFLAADELWTAIAPMGTAHPTVDCTDGKFDPFDWHAHGWRVMGRTTHTINIVGGSTVYLSLPGLVVGEFPQRVMVDGADHAVQFMVAMQTPDSLMRMIVHQAQVALDGRRLIVGKMSLYFATGVEG